MNRYEEMVDISEIYDEPVEHMSTRGVFRWVGIDVIEIGEK